jgi:hypothetical protein
MRTHLSQARAYYESAHLLMPGNGNSHNQLAVLRSYAEDDWGAVYHYYRSLSVSNPFITANSNVKTLLQKVVIRFKEGKLRPIPDASDLLKDLKAYVVLHAFLCLGKYASY